MREKQNDFRRSTEKRRKLVEGKYHQSCRTGVSVINRYKEREATRMGDTILKCNHGLLKREDGQKFQFTAQKLDG